MNRCNVDCTTCNKRVARRIDAFYCFVCNTPTHVSCARTGMTPHDIERHHQPGFCFVYVCGLCRPHWRANAQHDKPRSELLGYRNRELEISKQQARKIESQKSAKSKSGRAESLEKKLELSVSFEEARNENVALKHTIAQLNLRR